MPRENEMDLEEDLEEEQEADTSEKEDSEKEDSETGEQDDGSVVVDLGEDSSGVDTEGKSEEVEEEDESALQAKREARRQERQERKQRQREKDERLRRELDSERTARRQLEERLAAIERRSSGAEIAQLDQSIDQTRRAHEHFKNQIEIAQASNDGRAIAEATEKMILASQRHQQLTHIKQQLQQRQSAPAPLDERLVSNAQSFMQKHSWYRAEGRDTDSHLLRTIDNGVAAEGWDPTTPEYWEELESRIKKYLPHRAKGANMQPTDRDGSQGKGANPKQKSVVGGSGRETGSTASSAAAKGTFRLSAERVSAMKEAGIWDDPTQRKKAIEGYRDYDRQNKGAK
jgi:hypothetical protein